jgi:hypothetical protein
VILRPKKERSAPNPTQIEAAKANIAFALDALISLGKTPEKAAKTLLAKFPHLKNLAGPKSHRPDYAWHKTILEWRKTLSAPAGRRTHLQRRYSQRGVADHRQAAWAHAGEHDAAISASRQRSASARHRIHRQPDRRGLGWQTRRNGGCDESRRPIIRRDKIHSDAHRAKARAA